VRQDKNGRNGAAGAGASGGVDVADVLRRRLHVPVEKVVREEVNPRVRGWVNYFRWGFSRGNHSKGAMGVKSAACRQT